MRISDWSSDGCSSDLDRDDVGADLVRLARGIDHANTLWLGFGARQEAVTDLVHERQGFLFEAVFITACPRATQTSSAERRVGKACVSPCSSRWSTYPKKNTRRLSAQTNLDTST